MRMPFGYSYNSDKSDEMMLAVNKHIQAAMHLIERFEISKRIKKGLEAKKVKNLFQDQIKK
jgi:hypothetical protein